MSLMQSDYEKVELAIEFVRSRATEQPSLEQIANRVAHVLSPPQADVDSLRVYRD